MQDARAEDDSIRGYYKALYHLQLVCKLWSDVILSTPSLWSVVTNVDRSQVIERALALSREHPLVIWHTDEVTLPNRYMTPKATACLLDHSHRWLAPHVDNTYMHARAQAILSRGTPSLRFLSIGKTIIHLKLRYFDTKPPVSSNYTLGTPFGPQMPPISAAFDLWKLGTMVIGQCYETPCRPYRILKTCSFKTTQMTVSNARFRWRELRRSLCLIFASYQFSVFSSQPLKP